MELFLANDIFAAQVGEDLVFLDRRAGAYTCLTDGAKIANLDLAGGAISIDDQHAGELLALGLAEPRQRKSRTPKAAHARPARRARPARPKRLGWRQALAMLKASSLALLFSWRSFASLTQGMTTRGAAVGSKAQAKAAKTRLQEDLAWFEAIRPWLPLDGACLFRSCYLKSYLDALGHQTRLVIGVRTWPFLAHCWIQQGDQVLDDEVEHLLAYHIIWTS